MSRENGYNGWYVNILVEDIVGQIAFNILNTFGKGCLSYLRGCDIVDIILASNRWLPLYQLCIWNKVPVGYVSVPAEFVEIL